MTRPAVARLELVMLDGTGRRFALKEGDELTVGVAAHCVVRLTAPDVSRMHALISCRGGRVLLMDLGSKNGTFVGGKRIIHEVELSPGDSLRFSSMPAQLLPAGSSGGVAGQERTTRELVEARGDLWLPQVSPTTGDRLVPVGPDSVGWLLDRWGDPASMAVGTLVEWLVASCGMRGAAVVERVGRDISVAASHGAMVGMLPRVGPLAAIELATPTSPIPEAVSVTLAGERVVAISRQHLPWLLLLPGASMPDQEEIKLFARLLAVAWRIDRLKSAPTSPASTIGRR